MLTWFECKQHGSVCIEYACTLACWSDKENKTFSGKCANRCTKENIQLEMVFGMQLFLLQYIATASEMCAVNTLWTWNILNNIFPYSISIFFESIVSILCFCFLAHYLPIFFILFFSFAFTFSQPNTLACEVFFWRCAVFDIKLDFSVIVLAWIHWVSLAVRFVPLRIEQIDSVCCVCMFCSNMEPAYRK